MEIHLPKGRIFEVKPIPVTGDQSGITYSIILKKDEGTGERHYDCITFVPNQLMPLAIEKLSNSVSISALGVDIIPVNGDKKIVIPAENIRLGYPSVVDTNFFGTEAKMIVV